MTRSQAGPSSTASLRTPRRSVLRALVRATTPPSLMLADQGAAGMTLLTLSLNDLHAAGVHNAQVVNGLALFVGGLGQLLAGLWEVAAGNTLAATAFLGYGNFW